MRFAILIMYVFMLSCNSKVEKFYRTNHVEDIDVLPLIKPYRLWSPISGEVIWHLDFEGKVEPKPGWTISQMQVCKINVVKLVIFGHCINGYNSINASYFVVLPKENIEKIFSSKEEWAAYLMTRGVDHEKLYDVHEVYNVFKKNYRSLPWYDQVKNTNQ
jgi:hypothetical protein